MKILMCPKCGSSTLSITDEGNYLCLICNYKFNTSARDYYVNPYHRIVTFDYTTKKTLAFPKLNNNIESYTDCLFGLAPSDYFDCSDIDCDGCIFSKENYRMFTDVKEKEGE